MKSRLAGAPCGRVSGFGGVERSGFHAFDFVQGRLLQKARAGQFFSLDGREGVGQPPRSARKCPLKPMEGLSGGTRRRPLSVRDKSRIGFQSSVPAPIVRPQPVLRRRTQRERDYWTPQILPQNSPFHRPLTPNGLLGSVQRVNGPSISRCPEADANLPVPFTTFAVAL